MRPASNSETLELLTDGLPNSVASVLRSGLFTFPIAMPSDSILTSHRLRRPPPQLGSSLPDPDEALVSTSTRPTSARPSSPPPHPQQYQYTSASASSRLDHSISMYRLWFRYKARSTCLISGFVCCIGVRVCLFVCYGLDLGLIRPTCLCARMG